jgi:O-succinylbenzoic acid--CoA ligase
LREEAMIPVSNQFTIIYNGKPISFNTLQKKVDYYYNYFNMAKQRRAAVLFTAPHSPDFIFILLAIWKANVVAVPLDNKLTFEQMLNYKIPYLHNYIIHWDETTNTYRTQFFVNNDIPNEKFNGNLIVFTSGSENKPKGVIHNYDSLIKAAELWSKLTDVNNSDMWVASLPFYHIGGLSILFRAMIYGTKLLFTSKIKAATLFDEIKRLNVSYLSLVNPQLEYLINNNLQLPKTIKQIYLGGGKINSKLLNKAKELNLPAVLVYGSTETGAMVASTKLENVEDFDSPTYFCFENVDIDIEPFNDEEKNIGLAKIKSPSNCIGVMTENGIISDEYVKLNDAIQLNDDKSFKFVGRIDNIVNSGGHKINTAIIQNFLCSYENVRDAVVFGVDDEKLGSKLVAVIYSPEKIDGNKLKSDFEKNFTKYDIPKTVYYSNKPLNNEFGKIIISEIKNNLNLYQELFNI